MSELRLSHAGRLVRIWPCMPPMAVPDAQGNLRPCLVDAVYCHQRGGTSASVTLASRHPAGRPADRITLSRADSIG